MVEHQGPRRHAQCQIIIDGMQDVTSKLFPYLISVQVIDSIEGGHSECHIELDDRNAELQIPPDGVNLQVALGWAGEGPRLFNSGKESAGFATSQIIGTERQPGVALSALEAEQEAKFGGPGMELVFSGWVSSVESGFGRRGGGRRLWIEATSGNVKGQSKEKQSQSWGKGKEDDSDSSGDGKKGEIPLNQVMQDMAKKAGLTMKLSPKMMEVARDFWHADDSIQNFGQRIANEVGGVFSINGSVATLVGKGEGVNGDGQKMPTVEAIWGINLIGWRIKPYAGRPQYGEAANKIFKIHDAAHETIKGAIEGGTPFGGTDAIAHGVAQVADKATAEQGNTGTGESSKAGRGRGWILLNGEPRAKANGNVMIDGARPGVDGTYLITEAEHNYTRGVGFTTRCNVMYPTPKYGGYAWQRGLTEKQKAAKKKAEEEKFTLTPQELFRLRRQVEEDLAKLPMTPEEQANRDRLLKQEQDLQKEIDDMLGALRPQGPRVIG